MPYIGTSPSNSVRRVHTYTATASQTTFSGASSEGVTLSYADTNYIDVFQNGVLLGSADYTSTSGTSVVLAQGASVDDLIVIVVYDVFSVADTVSKTSGGSFDSAVTMSNNLNVSGAFTSQGIDDNADATAITIDSSEQVGIGQTTPARRLHIKDTSADMYIGLEGGTSNKVGILMGDTDNHTQSRIQHQNDDNSLRFSTDEDEYFRLMSTGRLEFQSVTNDGNVLQKQRLDWRNENNAGIMGGIGVVRTANANAPGAFVIRTSTDVDSSSNSSDGEISEKFRVAANGDLTATDTSIASNSDSRLKENISNFAYDLDKFKALKTKTFDWKNPKLHGDKSGVRGFVAQDIETVDAYWIEEIEVSKDSDDFQYLEDKDIFYTENSTIPDDKKVGDLEYKARFAKTSKLGQKDAMYVSVIQQLLTKIETLEADVKALKGE
jgi:hypothetical protein